LHAICDRSKGLTSDSNLNKKDRIIQSAANCFLQKGFAEVSLDDIANHGDVVKQTIYNYFDDKESLFNQTVEHLLTNHSVALPEDWYRLDPEAFLLKVAKLECQRLIEPGVIDFLRLLVKECRRFPELQVLYARSIPTPMIEFLAGYFQQSTYVSERIGKDQKLAFAIAWSFRAAVTGFATMLNLGPLVPYAMPTKSKYLQLLSSTFGALLKAPPASLYDDSNAFGKLLEVANGADDEKSFKDYLGVVRSQKQGEKKLEILFGAMRSFSEHGFTEASMDEVASMSSGSKQTIYKHFGSKRLLFARLFECVMEQLETVSFPDIEKPQSNYLALYSATLINAASRQWIKEYFRLIFGESQSFAKESGRLLVFLMDHGRTQLFSFMKKHGKGGSDVLCKSVALRCILGNFILLRQVYVLGEVPFIDEGRLIKILNGILDS
jgi:AcrR family transcriptional regulator